MVPTRRSAYVMCVTLLLGGVQGCTANENPSAPAARPEASPSTGDDSAEERKRTPGASTSPGASPSDPGTAECLARQRRAVQGMAFSMQQSIDEVMRSTDGVSADAAARVKARAERVERTLLKRCDRPTTAMRTYVRVVRQRTMDKLGSAGLDAVMSAYSAWAQSVGVEDVASELSNSLERCRMLRGSVHASYRTWWRWSDTGRDWWIELTFHNGLPRAWTATLSGRARMSYGGDGRGEIRRWGASSADYATVRRGTSHYLVWLGANGPYVATGPSGTLRVEDVGVSMDLPGARSWWCSLPVPESP